MLLLIIELVSMIEKLLAELNNISRQIKEHIQKNASEAQNQTVFHDGRIIFQFIDETEIEA